MAGVASNRATHLAPAVPVGIMSPMPALGHLIAPQLKAVDALFTRELASDLPNVNELVTHVGKFRGKMLRPMLVLLAGLSASDKPHDFTLTSNHVTLATVVEMIHMATLVHDDILDGAEIRRKGPTVNYLHGNEAAVLLGDYLISHAYHLCSSIDTALGTPTPPHRQRPSPRRASASRPAASSPIPPTSFAKASSRRTTTVATGSWKKKPTTSSSTAKPPP